MPGKQLHICLVTNEFPGLTETFITTKALELTKKGHRVTVIKNQDNKVINTSHLSLVRDAGVTIINGAALSTKKALLRTIFAQPALAVKSFSFSPKAFTKKLQQQLKSNMLARIDVDIIHVEFSGLAISYQQALEKTTASTVVSCRGTAEKVKPLSDPKRKEQLQKLFATVRAIHCVSADMAQTIQPYCNHPEKIFINRPSVDADIFRRIKPYKLENNTVEILSIGRFTFQKGYLVGLMAMKKIFEKGILFNWTIAGDGPLREEMLFHIKTLGLESVVKLVGKQNRDEILSLYNNTDIFLLCSLYEGIANVCLEAMSMEVPVVATKSGGMEEVITPETDGMLCEIYDAGSLANAVAAICGNANERMEMGIKARQKVLKDFTIQRQANVFEEKYLQLQTNL